MSNALDAFDRPWNPDEDQRGWYDQLKVKYPNLANALRGNEGSAKSGPVRPPFNLGFSTKEGKLRFTLYSPDSDRTYFGPIDDPSEPLEAAERALEGGLGEWSTKPRNGSGSNSRR